VKNTIKPFLWSDFSYIKDAPFLQGTILGYAFRYMSFDTNHIHVGVVYRMLNLGFESLQVTFEASRNRFIPPPPHTHTELQFNLK